MNKKIIIPLLLALVVLAALVYWFAKGSKEDVVDSVANNTGKVAPTVSVGADKINNKVKKLAIGEYGDLKDFIKKDLSDVDKKALQDILNERNSEKTRLLALIEKAKKTPNADAGLINKAIDEYNKVMSKFDARLEAYMTKDKFAIYTNTVVEKTKEEVRVKAYTK